MFNAPPFNPRSTGLSGHRKKLSSLDHLSLVHCQWAQLQGSEVEGTDVVATTLHALLELDAELQTKLDLAKLDHAKVAALMKLQVCRRPKCSNPRDSRAPHNSMLIVPGWENRLKHHVLIMAQSTINYGERGSIEKTRKGLNISVVYRSSCSMRFRCLTQMHGMPFVRFSVL